MKIHVLKDKTGKVVATFHKSNGKTPSIEPVLEHGQTVQEMDVPDDFHHNVKAFYEKHG
jgi:hypothetical protein